ncbi:MAG: hypothetical protein KBE65_23780 [Phycisphaerae bacterium]|nr:hypothetical protein [Phycisphaerae bacterium]
MLRWIEKNRIHVGYIQRPLVRMRVGGRANTIRGMLRGNREILHAFAANGLRPSPGFLFRKPLAKLGQFTRRSLASASSHITQGRHVSEFPVYPCLSLARKTDTVFCSDSLVFTGNGWDAILM